MINLKEAREWTTCLFSLAVPPMLWIGHVTMQNQRLEIAADIRRDYVERKEYERETAKLEDQIESTWRKLGETNGKIDNLTLQTATSTQILLDLKEEVKNLKK